MNNLSSKRNSKADMSAIPATPEALLAAVLSANSRTSSDRLKEILDSLLMHLHAFARETNLSREELEVGIEFLNRVGQATGPEKNEGILLADIFGLSTLAGLNDARQALAVGGTEPALIGPFWRANQPLREQGGRISSAETSGVPLFVNGRVTALDGVPIAGARIETWQASPCGLYENQDSQQEDMNLRGRFETDKNGCFSFYSVRPAGYPVPVDGPCGDLLGAQNRPIMRPAHIHFIVLAPGFKTLATQIFDATDPNVNSDVVFGAVGSLVQTFLLDPTGGYRLDLELKLEPGEMRMPLCPLP